MAHISTGQARPDDVATAQFAEMPARGGTALTVIAVIALLLSLLFAFSVLGTESAFAITRNDVLARAQKRVDLPVPYSQAKSYAGYRTDCSGYVSMCWATGTSWSTSSFYKVSHPISKASLQPGDALLKKGYHVRLFYGWLDDAHTQYVAYESADGVIAGCRIHSIADDLKFGYVPTRFDRISYSPPSRNLLKNGSFDSWAKSWGSQLGQPVWWQTDGYRGQTLVTHRQDTAHTTYNSLRLYNSSGDPGSRTELSQSAPVVAKATYRLTAWAKTTFDPRGVEMKLVYLDAEGESVAETSTTGNVARLMPTAWRSLSLLTTTPPDAVRALVTMRLAGATTTDTAGRAVTGSWAAFDDISLVRPQVTASIRPSITTAYNGKTVVLSGSVTPASAVGSRAVLYLQRPGRAWTKLSTLRVYKSGSVGAWKGQFVFSRSLPRGTYRFKTVVSAIPGYLGATTNSVAVTLK